MKNLEQLRNYTFHDSLLEKITYNKADSELILNIDFCNWKQEWFDENDEETSLISLVFKNVSKLDIPEIELNSDEIVSFIVSENSIAITILKFPENILNVIAFNAESVEIKSGTQRQK